jgi:uncharacterized protein (DUF58 family)
MNHENIHLRPTALWVIFGPVLGCMWLAAVNYSNNLVYAILYLIAALSFISVFHTWRNLAALRVEHVRVQPAFAGDEVRVEIFLRNPTKRTIYGLFFVRGGDKATGWRRPTPLRASNGKSVRLAAGDSSSVELVLEKKDKVSKWGEFRHLPAVAAAEPPGAAQKVFVFKKLKDLFELEKAVITPGSGENRGMYPLGSIIIRTSYPFGLIWASYRLPVDVEYYVYPKPKGTSVWPTLRPGGEHGSPTSNKPGDDFSGVRAYMPGESLRHVDWKAFARGRPLSIKQFSGGAGYELWLDAAAMDRLPLEMRLSQLALWIVNAEKEEIPYALKLGRTTLPLGLGPAHSRRALEALAVAGVGSA